MLKEDLEDELRRWREKRSRKGGPAKDAPKDRRTVRVNGQEVVVITKSSKRALA